MSLTAEFYASLEELLDQAFIDAPDKSIRGCFCDGILGPEWETDYLPVHVKTTKQITVRAWIDEGSQKNQGATQHLYKVILKLGPKALAAYLGHRSLELLPPQDDRWFLFSPKTKTITVRLV